MWAVNPHTYCDDGYSFLTHLCNCNFAGCFIRVWNLVCHIKGRRCTEGMQEQSAEGGIWTCKGGSNLKLEKTSYVEICDLYPCQILLRLLNQGGWDRQGMWHTWGGTEMHTEL